MINYVELEKPKPNYLDVLSDMFTLHVLVDETKDETYKKQLSDKLYQNLLPIVDEYTFSNRFISICRMREKINSMIGNSLNLVQLHSNLYYLHSKGYLENNPCSDPITKLTGSEIKEGIDKVNKILGVQINEYLTPVLMKIMENISSVLLDETFNKDIRMELNILYMRHSDYYHVSRFRYIPINIEGEPQIAYTTSYVHFDKTFIKM